MQLKNRDIICFAGEDWWYHNPHSNLHLMKSFAKHNRILFVNSIGVRMPSMKDKFFWKRVIRKSKSLSKYFRKSEKNIYVLTPVALPLFQKNAKAIQKINKVLLIIQIMIILKLLNFKRPIVWVCVSSFKDVGLYLRKKISDFLIYYCVDNYPYFSCVNQKEILSNEIEIQKNADLSLFVSHKLVEERKKYNSNTFYISHGVDYDHFAKCQKNNLLVPNDIKNIKRPIAGYVGALSMLDIELISSLAKENKNISFVFIGGFSTDLLEIKDIENIYILGKKTYQELVNYIQVFDCCCIFYKVSDIFNLYRHPKKLIEYLASGKPVVSVDIMEAAYYKDYIYVARDFEEFNQYLHQAIFKDSEEKKLKRMEYAKNHTWESVAAEVCEYILKKL